MADSKISALPASTTPLAGTEVLPIVQSSTTKQVSVANLTAGRDIAATSLTTTAVQATNSGGLTLKNSSGTTQLSVGAGGGDNITLSVATNITPANAAVAISPTGTGTVAISPAGALTINPTTASTINNTSIGATVPLTGAFTTVSATGTITQTGSGGTLAFNQTQSASGAIVNKKTATASNSLGTYDEFATKDNTGTANTWAVGVNVNSNNSSWELYNGGTRLSVTQAGTVTMGAYGVGTATFNASGVISSVSDENWKTKDGIPTNPDEMLQKLEPGYWFYNEEKALIFGQDRQLGFYAQNVREAIGEEAAPTPEEGKPWGYYDRSVLAITVMSLQKALATIDLLTARITALEAKST